MTGPVVECVPNFSEGADSARVEAIVAAMRGEGVHLLDWSMDADHNRSVVTIAGEPAAVVEAAVRGVGKAVELIDLTRQRGAHPRIGAADVIPFAGIGNQIGTVCTACPAGGPGNMAAFRGPGILLRGGSSTA